LSESQKLHLTFIIPKSKSHATARMKPTPENRDAYDKLMLFFRAKETELILPIPRASDGATFRGEGIKDDSAEQTPEYKVAES